MNSKVMNKIYVTLVKEPHKRHMTGQWMNRYEGVSKCSWTCH